MILDDILAAKRLEIEAAKQRLPLDELRRRVEVRQTRRPFKAALQHAKRPALIAELKRKSPSRGMLRDRFDPVRLAQELQEAGAAALSVLTDEPFFGGHVDFLRDAHQFTDIPALRKDFILEPYQVYEAVYYEADAILLIVGVLNDSELRQLLTAARQVHVEAIVEVHDEPQLARALAVGADLIGINHRDLRTFTMQPDTTARLVPKVPTGPLVIAESGVQTRDDVQRLQALGVAAVLVGEALMTAPDVGAKVRELFDGVW